MKTTNSRTQILNTITQAIRYNPDLHLNEFPPAPQMHSFYSEDEKFSLLQQQCTDTETRLLCEFNKANLLYQLSHLIDEKAPPTFISKHPICTRLRIREDLEALGLNTIGKEAFECNADGVVAMSQLQTAITGCDYVIAETGSVVISSTHGGDRLSSVLLQTHIVCFTANQILGSLGDFVSNYSQNIIPSWMCSITGSSRTADIEKQLVRPAHGVGQLILLCCRF